MIIKEVRIGAFGALKNKIIKFDEKINIIYGENEKGKSTIESFIKIMLYGFNRKGGREERKRYLPLDGEVLRGELIVEYLGREIIIIRSFGKTKKEDTSVIIDALTGEELDTINKDEPGKDFLNINKATFEKTLFISQLGVTVTKGKEEELMDKITTLFGCSEEEVPVNKALEKLQNSKKSLTTTRGIGLLDKLREKKSKLLEERYEGYKISEKNLEWETQLLQEKKKKNKLLSEIDNLEVYKKYLKKINIQKEYKEITDYLRKSEQLKKEENEIENDLNKGDQIINTEFLSEIQERNNRYLYLLNELHDIHNKIAILNNDKEILKKDNERYRYLELFHGDIKEKLISLKYEMKSISESLDSKKSLYNKIKQNEEELKENEAIKTSLLLNNNVSNIEELFELYEKSLREVSYLAENNEEISNIDTKIKALKLKRIIGIVALILGISISFKGFPILILSIILMIISVIILYKVSSRLSTLSSIKTKEDKVKVLIQEVKNIEGKLNEYLSKTKSKDYKELLVKVKKYNSIDTNSQKLKLKLEEQKKLLDEEEYKSLTEKYKKNIEMITSIKNVSNCNNLDEVLEHIKNYTGLNDRISNIQFEIERIEEKKKNLNSSILEVEKYLKVKLNIIGLDIKKSLNLDDYLNEYKEKIIKRDEIDKNLLAIEEAYKALLKDRDIDAIKEELKDIINNNYEYSYKSEEEIENEEKIKNKELLECEKSIKDIQNNINTRLIGKRTLWEIEAELEATKEEISSKERNLEAIIMATETIEESLDDIRREVGPTINKHIKENFEYLSFNKYDEVILKENYNMILRRDNYFIDSEYLSNGALDQLYLSLRIAFIELLFKNEEYPIILDDAFIQYDDNRRKKALSLINKKIKGQIIIFTCQNTEKILLDELGINFNYIYIS